MELSPDVAVVLVRHGETEWSSSGRHTSYTDVALTPRGCEQAHALATRLEDLDFSLVLSSPRQRARMTCAFAGLEPRAEITDDLAEWNYGEYEGRTSEQIRADVPGWTIFGNGAPGGETADEVVGARRPRARARGRGGRRRGAVLARALPARARRAVDRPARRRRARGSGSTPRR